MKIGRMKILHFLLETFGMELDYAYPNFYLLISRPIIFLKWQIDFLLIKLFLNHHIITTLAVFFILLNFLLNTLLESSQWLFSNLFFGEIVSDNILDNFCYFFVSFWEILVKFISNHLSKLFSLLNGLCFLNGGVKFSAFLWSLWLRIVLNLGHIKLYILWLILLNK